MGTKDQTVFKGKVISVSLDRVTLPNGELYESEHIHHPGGAVVVAEDKEERICLLRQYRHIAGQWLWELPAGRLEVGETPLETAKRELLEEAGVTAANWRMLGQAWSSPGVFDEVLSFFAATDLQPTAATPEPHELIEIHWLAREKVNDLYSAGEIIDAKTLVGLCQRYGVLE